MIVETKLTMTTIETVNRFRFIDQSIFKLPDEIQLDRIKFCSPFIRKIRREINENIVEDIIKKHEDKLSVLSLTNPFKKTQVKKLKSGINIEKRNNDSTLQLIDDINTNRARLFKKNS